MIRRSRTSKLSSSQKQNSCHLKNIFKNSVTKAGWLNKKNCFNQPSSVQSSLFQFSQWTPSYSHTIWTYPHPRVSIYLPCPKSQPTPVNLKPPLSISINSKSHIHPHLSLSLTSKLPLTCSNPSHLSPSHPVTTPPISLCLPHQLAPINHFSFLTFNGDCWGSVSNFQRFSLDKWFWQQSMINDVGKSVMGSLPLYVWSIITVLFLLFNRKSVLFRSVIASLSEA